MRTIPSKTDLKKYYVLFMEIGFICSLLIFIVAAKVTIVSDTSDSNVQIFIPDDVEIVISPITPPEKKPTPQKPMVFQEKPNDVIIEDPINDFPDFSTTDLPLIPPEQEIEEDKTHLFVQKMPEMKGGQSAFYKELNYPEMCKKAGIEGRVTLQFVINEQGEVTNPIVLRGIGGGCDEEALRVIKLMDFSPGIQNGRFVKVRMAQSIRFRLKH